VRGSCAVSEVGCHLARQPCEAIDAEARVEALGANIRRALQHARKTCAPAVELPPPEPGKGFDLLPALQETSSSYMIVKAFAQINKEEIDLNCAGFAGGVHSLR
jgi:hypothetical protein